MHRTASLRRWFGVLLAGFACVTVGVISVPTAAAAATRAPVPSRFTLQFGPIRAGGGFSAYVTDLDCGGADDTVEVTYLRTAGPAQLLHRYLGASGVCRVSSGRGRPRSAMLRVRVPGLIDIALAVDHVGRPLAHPGLPSGCGAPYGPELPARGRGRLQLTIHPSLFGRPTLQRVAAQLFPGAPQACPAQIPAATPQLTALIDAYSLSAQLPLHGPAQLAVTVPDGDQPGPPLTGGLEFDLSGSRAAVVRSNTVTLGSGSAFSRGSLQFATLPACPGSSANNGNLSGSFEIDDPLLGPITLVGANAQTAYLGSGADQPGGCNGPGSQPVSPALTSSCNLADSNCSVAANTNSATIFDETSPGTQTITSESVNFGDGSAPVRINNYGSVTHTYAAAGTYTATVTVTTNTDQTSAGSTSVVIDP